MIVFDTQNIYLYIHILVWLANLMFWIWLEAKFNLFNLKEQSRHSRWIYMYNPINFPQKIQQIWREREHNYHYSKASSNQQKCRRLIVTLDISWIRSKLYVTSGGATERTCQKKLIKIRISYSLATNGETYARVIFYTWNANYICGRNI